MKARSGCRSHHLLPAYSHASIDVKTLHITDSQRVGMAKPNKGILYL